MYKEPQHLFSTSYGKNIPRYHTFNENQLGLKKKKSDKVEISGKFAVKNQYSQKIRHLIDHVGNIVSKLIESLQQLYQTNGINYDVAYYYDTMMRLLTPHELLSHFHIVDNSHFFTNYSFQNPNNFCCNFKIRSDFKDQKIKILKYGNIDKSQKGQSNFNKFEQSFKLVKSSQLTKEEQKNPLEYSLQKNTQLYERDLAYNAMKQKQMEDRKLPTFRATTVLGADIEDQLASWAAKQLINHKLIRLHDISKKARQFTKQSQTFKSSLGWVTRFLNRHPLIHKMMKCLRKKDLKMLPDLYKKFMFESSNRQMRSFNEFNPKKNPFLNQKKSNFDQQPIIMNDFTQKQDQSLISEIQEKFKRHDQDQIYSEGQQYQEGEVKEQYIQYEQVPFHPEKEEYAKKMTSQSPASDQKTSKLQSQPSKLSIYQQESEQRKKQSPIVGQRSSSPKIISDRQLNSKQPLYDKNKDDEAYKN